MRSAAAIVALLILSLGPPAAAQQSPEAEVLAVVQTFFSALAAHDGDAILSVSLPEGRVYAMDEGLQATAPRARGLAEDAARLASDERDLLERFWNPTVLVHGPIATVWTRYDFHVNGEFSHCGVDHFSLIETPEGWKIVGISYTVEHDDCPVSPLGAPQ